MTARLDLENALAGLRVPAPAGFEPYLLLDGGVGDGLIHAQGPIGPIVVAFNKVAVVGSAVAAAMSPFASSKRAR